MKGTLKRVITLALALSALSGSFLNSGGTAHAHHDGGYFDESYCYHSNYSLEGCLVAANATEIWYWSLEPSGSLWKLYAYQDGDYFYIYDYTDQAWYAKSGDGFWMLYGTWLPRNPDDYYHLFLRWCYPYCLQSAQPQPVSGSANAFATGEISPLLASFSHLPTSAEKSDATTSTPPPPRQLPPPGSCPMRLTDVPAGSTFRPFIANLYCRGVVEGYTDNTFRPDDLATRGTLARWIVRSRGWATNTAGGPHFSDVPASSPLYPYIETAFNHGVISGYADRTFRPNNSVTRGQMSKMVVNAMGWAANTAGGPHFSDVPPGSAFYNQVETILSHGLVGGYSDRTFRPGNQLTRGQLSKVLSNAIAP